MPDNDLENILLDYITGDLQNPAIDKVRACAKEIRADALLTTAREAVALRERVAELEGALERLLEAQPRKVSFRVFNAMVTARAALAQADTVGGAKISEGAET